MINHRPFDAAHWYWKADDGRIFSSEQKLLVQASDAGYVAFAATTMPSRWPADASGAQTDASLAEVLTAYGCFISLAAQLSAYAVSKQAALVAAGISVNVAAAGAAPILVLADTNDKGRTDILGLRVKAKEDATTTTPWLQSTGLLTLTAPQIIAVADAVFAFYDGTYQVLGALLTDIAGGKVTTTAQVDGAAWPSAS